jgi:hypothetical protein
VIAPIQNRWKTATATVALAATLAWAWHWQSHAFESDLELQQWLGQTLAEQATRNVGKQGRILMIAGDAPQSAALRTQVEAFKAQLVKLGDYEVREYRLTNKSAVMHPLGKGLSWPEYRHALAGQGPLDLVVSFAGAPAGSAEAGGLSNTPKLLAECASVANLRSLFVRNLISAALVPRLTVSPHSFWHFQRGSSNECFTRQYQIITRPLASSLPAP